MGCADAAQSPVSKRLRIPLEKDLGCVCLSEEGQGPWCHSLLRSASVLTGPLPTLSMTLDF